MSTPTRTPTCARPREARSRRRPSRPRAGLELLERQLAGELPRSPIDNLTGIRLVEAEDGRVKFAMPATGWCANELGTVFGGMVALLASRRAPPPFSPRRPSAPGSPRST